MAATVEIDGQTATIEENKWTGDEMLVSLLNAFLDPAGPSGSDPNPDWTSANEAIKRFGGKILKYDRLKFDPRAVY
jgi:hypothetical protein